MPFVELNSKRLLFIHIPKTGGTSIERWLAQFAALKFRTMGLPEASKCTPQHFRMRDIRALFGENYFDYSFAFVRNPYDRMESEYRMQATLQKAGFWKEYQSFSMWLEANLSRAKNNPFHADNHFRAQWEFLGSDVDIFKFEDGLMRGLEKAATLLGISLPEQFPHELSTSRSEVVIQWDLADRILVQEYFRKDFELFGYEFSAES